jgi:peptidyl-prolyl cis-trans isomerase C
MKNSKKLLSIVVGLALMSSTALFAEEAKVAEKPAEKSVEKTEKTAVVAAKDVATVNGSVITAETLNAYMNVINRSRPEGGVSPKEALDDLIITELALQHAKADGVAESEELKKQIAEAAKKVILTTWTREKSENMKIDDAELKAAYDENMKGQASKEYKARHILVKKEDIAKAIIKELVGGGDFEKLAKENQQVHQALKGGI